jgi:hypothetical protein
MLLITGIGATSSWVFSSLPTSGRFLPIDKTRSFEEALILSQVDVLRLFDWLAERWEVLPLMTVSPALLPQSIMNVSQTTLRDLLRQTQQQAESGSIELNTVGF